MKPFEVAQSDQRRAAARHMALMLTDVREAFEAQGFNRDEAFSLVYRLMEHWLDKDRDDA